MIYDDQLDELAQLDDNWDSYGAQSIDLESFAAVRVFLDAVINGQASITPGKLGEVTIEIHEQDFDIEACFHTDYIKSDLSVDYVGRR